MLDPIIILTITRLAIFIKTTNCRINCGSGYLTYNGSPDTQFVFMSINAHSYYNYLLYLLQIIACPILNRCLLCIIKSARVLSSSEKHQTDLLLHNHNCQFNLFKPYKKVPHRKQVGLHIKMSV